MAVSQFRYFSSADVGAPQLSGTSGSLVALLDAVLVNGYAGTASLGWTKPLPNDPLTSSLACWQMPSGSRMILYVNDAAPTGSTIGSGREAWACGYESILGLTGSTFPTIGTGAGQFPTASQYIPGIVTQDNGAHPSGSMFWRKSATVDSASRYWQLYGDSSTFYMFVQANDTFNVYYVMWFGDIYSANPNDPYRCMIHGRSANKGNSYPFDGSDLLQIPSSNGWPNFFMPRSWAMIPGSVRCNKVGDRGKATVKALTTPPGGSENIHEWAGSVSMGADNSLILSPIHVIETPSCVIRGRMRGLYQACHPSSIFSDGQTLTGGNEHAGKTFRCIKPGPFNNGTSTQTTWIIETSNTLETN
jgi:hypothetical protein